LVFPAADIHLGAKAMNEVQEKVAQLKNRVAEFLLVIAKVGKNMENSLPKTSNDVMDELKELKEYVRIFRKNSLFICFAHVLLKVSCFN
jgi:hypothetical protein